MTSLYDSPTRPEDTTLYNYGFVCYFDCLRFLKENLGPLVGVDILKLEKENKELKEKLAKLEGK